MSLKTHKATANRIRVTKKGKLMKKTCGQDHFNARETGKVTRNKRGVKQMSQSNKKAIKQLLPHS